MCSTCRSQVWLEANIDGIEEYIKLGYSVEDSIRAVKKDNKRFCRNCGEVIDKGNFCSTRISCRKAYNRFIHKRRKGLTVETAIREAVCKS